MMSCNPHLDCFGFHVVSRYSKEVNCFKSDLLLIFQSSCEGFILDHVCNVLCGRKIIFPFVFPPSSSQNVNTGFQCKILT